MPALFLIFIAGNREILSWDDMLKRNDLVSLTKFLDNNVINIENYLIKLPDVG